jgi:hypothetical protein
LAVIDTLGGLGARIGQLLGSAFEAFAIAAKTTLREAGESEGLTLFGESLRASGRTLKAFSEQNSEGATLAKLEALAGTLGDSAFEVASPAVAELQDPVVSIADLAPITKPATEAPATGSPAASQVTASQEAVGLAASFVTYHQLRMEGRTVGPEQDTVSSPLAEPVPEGPVVEIETLLFQGAAAQERVRLLGREISECLDRPGIFMGLRPLLEELLDLLPRADDRIAS